MPSTTFPLASESVPTNVARMKSGTFFACLVPELRRLTGSQLMLAWQGGTEFSRPKIYLHCVLLLACSSVIFNTVMRLTGSTLVDLLGLIAGLTLPPNLYFLIVFNNRRPRLREFLEENWETFRPDR